MMNGRSMLQKVFAPVFCRISHRLSTAMPPASEDRYGGRTLNIGKLVNQNICSKTPKEFDAQLKGWLQSYRDSHAKACWLHIPIELGSHISVAADNGFQFHHAEGNDSLLCQWLHDERPSKLPRYATHQVGCSGCVVREDTQEILVVRDRYNPYTLWKFPGGLSELGEDVQDTAIREVYEETGIQTEFNGVMMFRQQHNHPGAHGRSDFFFVCHLKPLTFDINLDPMEVTDCCWMSLDELENSAQKSAITLKAINMVRKGLQDGFQSVTLSSESCKSVYKGMEFKVHNVPMDDTLHEQDYAHSLTELSK